MLNGCDEVLGAMAAGHGVTVHIYIMCISGSQFFSIGELDTHELLRLRQIYISIPNFIELSVRSREVRKVRTPSREDRLPITTNSASILARARLYELKECFIKLERRPRNSYAP